MVVPITTMNMNFFEFHQNVHLLAHFWTSDFVNVIFNFFSVTFEIGDKSQDPGKKIGAQQSLFLGSTCI